jgi:hypothetical protein
VQRLTALPRSILNATSGALAYSTDVSTPDSVWVIGEHIFFSTISSGVFRLANQITNPEQISLVGIDRVVVDSDGTILCVFLCLSSVELVLIMLTREQSIPHHGRAWPTYKDARAVVTDTRQAGWLPNAQ